MKANAPERIWIDPANDLPKLSGHIDKDSVEYIRKSALLAEINKRIIDAPINNIGHQRVWAYNDVKDILGTQEVKEVDLDFEQELYKAFGQVKDFTLGMRIARYFFELGMAVSNEVQKGEEV